MNNKILIRNITNLTNARYFAAMNVDWISIRLTDDLPTFSKWHTIRDWISGVKLAAEIINSDESLIAKTIIEAKPEGVISDDLGIIHLTGGLELFVTTEIITSGSKDLYSQIIPIESYGSLANIPPHTSEQTYIEAAWTPDMITALMKTGYSGSFSFASVNETDNGMKDYSVMDEMIGRIKIDQ